MEHAERLLADQAGISQLHAEKLGSLARAMADETWRDACFERVGNNTFPAIVTYLSQLLAHDVSMFTRADTRFDGATPGIAPQFTNARTSPLMLHTIYGDGLALDDQLYTVEDHMIEKKGVPVFKMAHQNIAGASDQFPAFEITIDDIPKPGQIQMRPVLGDSRNADTSILLWIATAFMRFHNLSVRNIADQSWSKSDRHWLFQAARTRTIFAFYSILEHEVMPPVVGSDTPRAFDTKTLPQNPSDFFHGLLRAFHVLPLKRYTTQTRGIRQHDLSVMMESRATRVDLPENFSAPGALHKALNEWKRVWGIDAKAFSDTDSVNQTCFTPSFGTDFGGESIMLRDIIAQKHFGVSKISMYPGLEQSVEATIATLSNDVTEEALPSGDDVPLSFGFLAEAFQSHGKPGALGKSGAEMFATQIYHWIDGNTQTLDGAFGQDALAYLKHDLPKSFLQLSASR